MKCPLLIARFVSDRAEIKLCAFKKNPSRSVVVVCMDTAGQRSLDYWEFAFKRRVETIEQCRISK